MQRYFITKEQLEGRRIMMDEETSHHMLHVMRMKKDELCVICLDDGTCYTAFFSGIQDGRATVLLGNSLEQTSELPISVTISQAIIKGDKMDTVVQKGVECGAFAFLPVAMKRSIVQMAPKKREQRQKRWQKIALEAARQAHRQIVPVVHEVVNFKDLVSRSTEYDVCLVADEAHDERAVSRFKDLLCAESLPKSLLLLIGPEGGIDDEERHLLNESGFLSIGLGKRILRTETAALWALAAIGYELEL